MRVKGQHGHAGRQRERSGDCFRRAERDQERRLFGHAVERHEHRQRDGHRRHADLADRAAHCGGRIRHIDRARHGAVGSEGKKEKGDRIIIRVEKTRSLML